ncbi:mechanosensitive ion channel family protein [Pseudomonas sp. BMS12]|uniref:mechanosensitive ion channel family protein n=1 Tax=Pseudomonas sp. BMS12 TaxID=1796033 RepID=UPI00083B96A3|nr:mechanosensitive ion channel domain-containing protein [Pseudomonas sp. BMS12]
MEFNLEELIKLSESWLPVVLEYSGKVTLALLTLLLGWWLINRVTRRLQRLMAGRRVDAALTSFIGSLANMGLKVLLLVSVASMVGISTASFIAVIGAAGLAIGLALQGSLSNFAGGVLILLFRPFRIGDWIEAQGVSGTVDSIQIFHTVLRTVDNKTVILPNGALSNGAIVNSSHQATRKVIFNIGVDYDADLQAAREVLLGLARDSRVLTEPKPEVVVTSLGDSAITLSLRLWVNNGDYWGVMFMLNEGVRDGLRQAGIDIPFPQRVVRMVSAEASA